MSVHLVGGGPDTCTGPDVVAGFLDEVRVLAGRARVAVVLHDRSGSAAAFLPQYAALLGDGCDVVPVPFAEAPLDALPDVDGVVVAGGSTPAYLHAVRPVAGALRSRVSAGLPYLGFSAGAMIAGARAVVGGWLDAGRPVVPQAWSEGLGEVTRSVARQRSTRTPAWSSRTWTPGRRSAPSSVAAPSRG